MNELKQANLAARIIGLAHEIQQSLGEECRREEYIETLDRAMREDGLSVKRNVWLPEIYKGLILQCGHEVDLLADDRVAVLVNQSNEITDEDEARLLACLRLGGYIAGLFFNFNEPIPEKGVKFLAYGVPALCWAESHSDEI